MSADRSPWASFSPCKKYRYMLAWPASGKEGIALFTLANPSTATADKTDPTVARCIGYAGRWGYAWCYVVNARAWRETNPKLVPADPLAIGPDNDDWIEAMSMSADVVICGWGKLAGERAAPTLEAIRRSGKVPHVLALNNDGTPRHPLARGKLALRADAKPLIWGLS